MGMASSEKETQRKDVGPCASVAAYRYFGTCNVHGRIEINAPGISWPPACPRCGSRVDHNRVTRARS